MLHNQINNCLFITGSEPFSPGNIKFHLVYDEGQCVEPSYLNETKGAVIIYDRDRSRRHMGGGLENSTVSKEGFQKSF